MRTSAWLLTLGACVLMVPGAGAEMPGWPQWRGPARTGAIKTDGELISKLPQGGLKPVWSSEKIPSGRSGGWSSPVVHGPNVYVFTHQKIKKTGADTPKKKYPWLAPDKRGHLTDEEYKEYEKKRRQEDLDIGKGFFKFVEILYCLDYKTGQTVWKKELPSVYTRFLHSGTPAIRDNKLYVLGAARTARCYDINPDAKGAVVWEKKLEGEFTDEFLMSSFVLAKNIAVIQANGLFALDATTGDLKWTTDPKKTSGGHSSPVVYQTGDGQTLVIANVSGRNTIAVDLESGKEVWKIESQAGQSTPLVVGDILLTYGRSRKAGLRAFKLAGEKPESMWVYQGCGDKGSSPVVVGSKVYVQGERRLACVDLNSGKQEWRTNLDLSKPQYISPIGVGDRVFYTCDGLLMFKATPEQFTPLIEARFNKAHVMDTEENHRKALGLDKLKEESPEKAQKKYQNEVGRQGPLVCATPAFAHGRLFLRFNNALVCYDFRPSDK